MRVNEREKNIFFACRKQMPVEINFFCVKHKNLKKHEKSPLTQCLKGSLKGQGRAILWGLSTLKRPTKARGNTQVFPLVFTKLCIFINDLGRFSRFKSPVPLGVLVSDWQDSSDGKADGQPKDKPSPEETANSGVNILEQQENSDPDHVWQQVQIWFGQLCHWSQSYDSIERVVHNPLFELI